MPAAWKVAVVLGLLAGIHVSRGRRELQADLMGAAQADFRRYPDGGDTAKIGPCSVGPISREDAARLRSKFNGVYRFGGACKVSLTFRDYPRRGQESRLNLTARYGWAPTFSQEYKRGWMKLPFEIDDRAGE